MVSLINQLSAYRLVLSNGIVIVVIVVCVSVLGYVMSSSLASCIHRLNNINQNNKIIYQYIRIGLTIIFNLVTKQFTL